MEKFQVSGECSFSELGMPILLCMMLEINEIDLEEKRSHEILSSLMII